MLAQISRWCHSRFLFSVYTLLLYGFCYCWDDGALLVPTLKKLLHPVKRKKAPSKNRKVPGIINMDFF